MPIFWADVKFIVHELAFTKQYQQEASQYNASEQILKPEYLNRVLVVSTAIQYDFPVGRGKS